MPIAAPLRVLIRQHGSACPILLRRDDGVVLAAVESLQRKGQQLLLSGWSDTGLFGVSAEGREQIVTADHPHDSLSQTGPKTASSGFRLQITTRAADIFLIVPDGEDNHFFHCLV